MRPSINLVVSELFITLDEFCCRTGYKLSYARQMIREGRLPIRKKERSTNGLHFVTASTRFLSKLHWGSVLEHTFGVSAAFSSSPLPTKYMIIPTMIISIRQPLSFCFAPKPGSFTPQCGQVFAEVDTSFLHSLHLVSARNISL